MSNPSSYFLLLCTFIVCRIKKLKLGFFSFVSLYSMLTIFFPPSRDRSCPFCWLLQESARVSPPPKSNQMVGKTLWIHDSSRLSFLSAASLKMPFVWQLRVRILLWWTLAARTQSVLLCIVLAMLSYSIFTHVSRHRCLVNRSRVGQILTQFHPSLIATDRFSLIFLACTQRFWLHSLPSASASSSPISVLVFLSTFFFFFFFFLECVQRERERRVRW